MNRSRIIQPDQSYTFSKYFDLPFSPEDILAELGCSYQREMLKLPSLESTTNYQELQRIIERNLRRVKLLSEDARKQAIIAPILLEVCDITESQLNIEYSINVSNQLKGSLDYYINNHGQGLLVIEAKQADLSKGFTQLAVELIALNEWINSDKTLLYGVVTTGEDWRFAIYKCQEKEIVEDIKLYRVPEELTQLVKILVAIVSN